MARKPRSMTRSSGGHLSSRGRYAARVWHEQHDVRGTEECAAMADRWAACWTVTLVCDTVQRRSPPSWVAKLLARSAKLNKEPISSCIGAEPGRVPSAPFHQVHDHAEEQVSAARARIARWCWWIFARRRAPRRPIFSAAAPGKRFRVHHDPAGDESKATMLVMNRSPRPV